VGIKALLIPTILLLAGGLEVELTLAGAAIEFNDVVALLLGPGALPPSEYRNLLVVGSHLVPGG
jgi:hypothetical protein